jgi:uncharacterized protein (DUF58 family)
VQRLVRDVLAAEETFEGTDIRAALRFVSATQRRKAVIFLLSDFQDAGYEKELTAFARRHDVIACRVTDPAELELPNVGIVELLDPETQQTILVDTSSAEVRQHFESLAADQRFNESKFFLRAGIDLLDISTDRPYVDAVRELFRRRALRRH